MFEIIKTKDGSDTVFSKQFNATYHSVYGALNESQHVYIKNGLLSASERFHQLNILEVGLGTCLNAGLTLQQNLSNPIIYIGVEKYPLPDSVWTQLNFGSNTSLYRQFHQFEWNKTQIIRSNFMFTKYEGDIYSFEADQKFNLVYYDAFAPSSQIELWNETILKKLFDSMITGAILVTFCANGNFKRTLKAIGFIVEVLPGPPGKREITRAIKP